MVEALAVLILLVLLSNLILWGVVFKLRRRVTTAGLVTKAFVADLRSETVRAQSAEAVLGRMTRGHRHTGVEVRDTLREDNDPWRNPQARGDLPTASDV